MREQTLVVVKPDGVKMSHAATIKTLYIMRGLELIAEKRFVFLENTAEQFYKDHEGKYYFAGLVLAMMSGPCEAFILRGENAIEVVREMNGATNPKEAAPGTIRHRFMSAGGPFNTVHASDSKEAFERESALLFRSTFSE